MTTKRIIPRTGVSSLSRAVAMATPQSLVHIKHTISLQQYKYFLLLFDEMCIFIESGIESDDDGFYSIRMNKITERLGYTPNKKEIWDDFVALKNETIAVNYLMKDGQPIKYGSGYISEWGISNTFIKFKLPTFFIEVAKKFKEQRRLFLLLNWEIFNSFSGKYEAILYKLCKDYENSGGKRTPEFSIENFREYIGLRSNEHREYKIMKAWCISKPLKKINESEISDITINLKEKKVSAKVISIFFEVESKKEKILTIENDPLDDPFALAYSPIPPNLQSDFLRKNSVEDAGVCIRAANEWIDVKLASGESVVYGKIYRKALIENWKPNDINIGNIKDDEIINEKCEKENDDSLSISKWIGSIFIEFEKLPDDQKSEIRNNYAKTLSSLTVKSFSKRGEYAPMHRLAFARFFSTTQGKSPAF